MELLTFNHSGYPRIGESSDEQALRRAIAKHDRGETTDAEVRAAQDHLVLLALEDQQNGGIDIVTDGQIRWNDPVSHLAGKLQGVRINGLLRFFDTNFYFRQPVVGGRIERTRPLIVEDFRWAARRSRQPVKAVLTGPYTLARLSIRENGSASKGDITMAYAEALAAEIAALDSAGANRIQVDEPALLRHPGDINLAREALGLAVSRKGGSELALATYFGDAAPVYTELHAFPVDALVLDFTYSPELPRVIESEGSDKAIGFGLLDGRNTRLEDHATTSRTVERMLARVKAGRSYLTSSCSLEYLPRDRARLKLRHLTLVKKSLLGEA
jgi:5-methyltetrahydropteroyltriglutamate--homocysteine methyltransferase